MLARILIDFFAELHEGIENKEIKVNQSKYNHFQNDFVNIISTV